MMAEETVTCQVTVTNEQGLHLRPADALVQLAQRFVADIELVHEDGCFDAKSILEVMALGAGPGTQLVVQARGLDAKQAVALLASAFHEGFDQTYSTERVDRDPTGQQQPDS